MNLVKWKITENRKGESYEKNVIRRKTKWILNAVVVSAALFWSGPVYGETGQTQPFQVFYDDFNQASFNEDGQYKTVGNTGHIKMENGALKLDATAGASNYVLVDSAVFAGMQAQEGYRMSVDMGRGGSADGTVQLMFRGSDTAINSRYVLALNTQGSAPFCRFLPGGDREELARAGWTWPAEAVNVAVEVRGNTVTFLADGQEVLAYTSEDNWKDMGVAAGVLNMTGGAPVVMDHFKVERIAQVSAVSVTSKYEEDGARAEDTDGTRGTALSDVVSAASGSQVTLTAQAKAGWRLKGYETSGLELGIADGVFTVPAGAPENIAITAVFEPEALRAPAEFYIDSQSGNDAAQGTSAEDAWRTLAKLKEFGKLVPGDKILLKRGSAFDGVSLEFAGMGTEQAPIVIDAYGEGELPRLNGNGQVENVVSLYNQEYIEIRNLEITNRDSGYNSDFGLNTSNNNAKTLRAINVSIKDFGTVSGIVIDNCYIHDINGNIALKWNGGIFFDVQAGVEDGKLIGVPSKYDNVRITDNTFERVDRSGIKLVSSAWCNQWAPNAPSVPENWYPSTGVVVSGNYMDKIGGGDGITTRDTQGALIEYNLVRDCRYQNTGYNVGIWPFEASNTVIQYNEAYNTHSIQDGQGFDCDHASSYTVMQYNYSHNNEGGFMLIMGGYPHTAPTVRYNVSQNDRDKAFEFSQGMPKGTMIYNNTIYSDQTVNRGIVYLSNAKVGVGVNDAYLFNNLFHYPQGQKIYGGDGPGLPAVKKAAHFYHNGYAGGMQGPEGEEGAVYTANAGLAAAGTGPVENTTGKARTGKSGDLDGYKLTEGSPMIDAGATMEEAVGHFGLNLQDVVDGRNSSPRELYEAAYSMM